MEREDQNSEKLELRGDDQGEGGDDKGEEERRCKEVTREEMTSSKEETTRGRMRGGCERS